MAGKEHRGFFGSGQISTIKQINYYEQHTRNAFVGVQTVVVRWLRLDFLIQDKQRNPV
jgi:hypothetical protein